MLRPTVWTVPLSNTRGIPSGALRQLALAAGLEAEKEESLKAALTQAMMWAREHEGAICIAGSLFLVGEALQQWETEAG